MPSVADNYFREPARTTRSGEINFSGRHLTTTAGALSVAAGAQDAPLYTLTRTGAGRYTIQFVNSKGEAVTWLKLAGFQAWLETATLAAAQGGSMPAFVISSAAIATTGAVTIGFNGSGGAADVPDAAIIGLRFTVKRSSAVP